MSYERIVVKKYLYSQELKLEPVTKIKSGLNRDLDFDSLPFSKEITSTRPQPIRHSSSVAGELSSFVLRKRKKKNIVKYP